MTRLPVGDHETHARTVLDELGVLFAIFADAARDRGATSALLALLQNPSAPVFGVLADWVARTQSRAARARRALVTVESAAPDLTAMFLVTARQAVRDLEEAARNVLAVLEQR